MKYRKNALVLAAAALVALSWATTASAFDRWQIRTTVIGIFFDASSDTLDLDVEDQTDLAIDVTYFFTPYLAANLLATFTNTEVTTDNATVKTLAGGDSLGSVDVLPPIFTLQWHFMPGHAVQPYAGVGFNYNVFSQESGDLDQFEVEVDDEFGLVAVIGADFRTSVEHLYLNFNVKYIDLDADVDVGVNSALNDKLTLDPVVVGAGVGYRF